MVRAGRAVNIILISGGLVCIAIMCYFIYVNSWTHQANFVGTGGVIMRYVFPAILAAGLFASLRLPPAYRVNLCVLLISTVFSFYSMELFLDYSASNMTALRKTLWLHFPSFMTLSAVKDRWQVAREKGVDFDTRSRLEVINDLAKKGIEAYPVVPSTGLLERQADGSMRSVLSIDGVEVLPLGGIANTVTVFCNENGRYTIYKSDEHGFHNPKGIWASGRVDIAALGDSMTHGGCVGWDENYVAVIRNHYSATLSLGSDNNGPLAELAGLKEYLQILKPKLVLWFYFEGNDLNDLSGEKNSPLLMRYLTSDFRQGLLSKQPDIDRALAAYVERVKDASKPHIRLREFIRLHYLRESLEALYRGQDRKFDQAYVPPAYSMAEIELLGRILFRAKATVSAWGGTLYFVYLPEWQRYSNAALANKDRGQVLALVKALGLPLIDLHPAFAAQSDPLALFPFRLEGHYNAKGHRLVAEEVLRSINPFQSQSRWPSRPPGRPVPFSKGIGQHRSS
jgi:hypothetical protein